jgi:CHRD domain-containing protein/Big-like domain-containing protein
MRQATRFNLRNAALALLAGGLAGLVGSCGGGYGGGGGGGGSGMVCGGVYAQCPPPSVALSTPASGTTVSMMVALTATASASSTYGLTITSVSFLIDGTVVGTAMSSPYTVNWDSTTVANGSHQLSAKATDSMNDTATTPAITITVQNTAAMSVAMTALQIFPAPRSQASGMAAVTVKLETGAASGTVTLSGMTAIAVTVNDAFAGAAGPAVLRLAPRAGSDAEWLVPEGALLSADELEALQQGRLYVVASSAAHPAGEIRGQLAPEHVLVSFSALHASEAARALGLEPTGMAATTVDTRAHTVSVHLSSSGVDDAMAARLESSRGGTALPLAPLVKDGVTLGHWSTERAGIADAELAALRAGGWSLSVLTPALSGAALVGAIEAPHRLTD